MLSAIRKSFGREDLGRKNLLAALEATFIADAASSGVEWIYDFDKLKEVLQGHWDKPEFHEPPACPFYDSAKFPGHYEAGMPSPYAEECLALLSFMDENGGDFAQGSAFAKSLDRWAKAYKGRKNHATILFEENMAKLHSSGDDDLYPRCGADDAQANAFWKVAPLCTRYADEPLKLMQAVEVAVRTHQNKDPSAAFAMSFARILLAAAKGSPIEKAVAAGKEDADAETTKWIDRALNDQISSIEDASPQAMQDYITALAKDIAPETKPFMAKSCGFPWSLIIGLKLALDAVKMQALQGGPDKFDAFSWAVRQNIHVGGDCCGRVPIVAGILACAGHRPDKSWEPRVTTLPLVRKTGAVLISKV